jgi:hypothetical protein
LKIDKEKHQVVKKDLLIFLLNSDANCKGTGFSFNASPGSKQFPSWIDNKSSSWKCVVDN